MTGLKRLLRPAILAFLTVLSIGSISAQAWADTVRSWVLKTQSGQVRLVKSGISPIALTVGDVFAGGDWIETGPDGRAILGRGEETIVVAPNSRIGLPRDKSGPFATRILQTLGTILLTVEKKANQHFEVQTPYLAAVVKGTTFTVGINGGRAVVHVVEGLVEVTNLASGQSRLVAPGQTGAVERGGAAGVQVDGGAAEPRAEGDGPAAGKVVIREILGTKSVDLSASTGGLIRDAASAGGWDSVEAPELSVGQSGIIGQTLATASNVTTTSFVGDAAAPTLSSGAIASNLQPVSTSLSASLQPVSTSLGSSLQPVSTSLSSSLQPVATSLSSSLQPITAPLASVVQPVAAPLVPSGSPLAPLVDPLLGN